MTNKMKKQTGILIDSEVWNAYRGLCKREKLLPSEAITEFLGLVLRNGSPLAVVDMMQLMVKERTESLEAYARVLLNWYKNGKTWIHVTDESEAAVEPMLLQVLKDVVDPQLRREIEETLAFRPRRYKDWIDRKKKTTEKTVTELAKANISERIGDIKKQVAGRDMGAEQAQEMWKKIRQIREKLENDRKDRARKR
jgi:uncharacterized membrane-anchored protein YjiN (DUF445 family)